MNLQPLFDFDFKRVSHQHYRKGNPPSISLIPEAPRVGGISCPTWAETRAWRKSRWRASIIMKPQATLVT